MEKFFTKGYSPFMLLAIGLWIGLGVVTENLQLIATTVGMTGLVLGMTKQVIMQYRLGKVGLHWMFITIMFVATILRGTYMIRTGHYWIAIPDVYGVLLLGIVQLQLAGYLLKKQPESE